MSEHARDEATPVLNRIEAAFRAHCNRHGDGCSFTLDGINIPSNGKHYTRNTYSLMEATAKRLIVRAGGQSTAELAPTITLTVEDVAKDARDVVVTPHPPQAK